MSTETEQSPATTEAPQEIPRIKFLSDAFIAAADSSDAAARGCFVLGATGETGKRIVRLLVISGAFSLIKLITRRPVPPEYIPEAPSGVKIEQIVIPDFNTIAEDTDIFQGCHYGFCALGTTRKKAGGSEPFRNIDHDLTFKLLRLAKSSDCKYLALVSAAGAASSSIFLYSQTKGQLEDDTIALQFDALRIYRPAMIQVKRKEERLAEELALIIAPILDFCSLGRAAIKIDTLVDSIVKDALIYGASPLGDLETRKHLIFYDNKSIKSTR